MQNSLNLNKILFCKTVDLKRYFERCCYEYGINKTIVGVAMVIKITITTWNIILNIQ